MLELLNERFYPDDIIKIIGGRKIPVGTVAKIILGSSTKYGDALLLDCGEFVPPCNCTHATQTEIQQYYNNLIPKSQAMSAIQCSFTFTGIPEQIGGFFDQDHVFIYEYLFTTPEGNILRGQSYEELPEIEKTYKCTIQSYDVDDCGSVTTKIKYIAEAIDYEFAGPLHTAVSFAGTFKYYGITTTKEHYKGYELRDNNHIFVCYQSEDNHILENIPATGSITGNFTATIKSLRTYRNKKITIIDQLQYDNNII